MKKRAPDRFLAFFLLLGILSAACSGGTKDNWPGINEPALHLKASFPLGVAVGSPNLLNDSRPFRELTLHHFDRLTPGNDMKMDALHPAQNTYNWTNADFFVEFCKLHDKKIYGHVLELTKRETAAD